MTVLVAGAAGQLGREIVRLAGSMGAAAVGADRAALDVTDARAVRQALASSGAEAVINAAAYTAVDRAETERDLAFAVNRDGARHLADACRQRGVPLVHVSTDYVFDGAKGAPYAPDDPVSPVNVYGASKAAGEDAATAHAAFSAAAMDRGSALLAEALPARLPARVADLGAGWGALALRVLEREGVEECHLIEAEWDALEAARLNVADPRARFRWADATSFESDEPFDAVVMNPPFHRGRDADPEVGRAFLRAAARVLVPRGTLWCVANRHLPYERTLAEAFAETREVAGDAAYKVLTAARPLSSSSGASRTRRRRAA